MWTQGRDKNTGKFYYKLYSFDGKADETVEGFDNYYDCQRAAEEAQRRDVLRMQGGAQAYGPEIAAMTDDELLAELEK